MIGRGGAIGLDLKVVFRHPSRESLVWEVRLTQTKPGTNTRHDRVKGSAE